jgi:hypothetical protein
VLSFEEEDIPEDQKKSLMESFEKTVFAGLEEDQYNILWVEHTDKGRLELNFVIPKLHLGSKKQYQPYYHKQDFPLLEKWQRMENLKYGFSDPKDPAKSRSFRSNIKNWDLVEDYTELDDRLHEAVLEGLIGSRAEMIKILEKSGIKVTRSNDKGMSIQLAGKKRARRFKGVIYEQWNSFRELEGKFEETEREIRAYNRKDPSEEFGAVREGYLEYLGEKSRRNREKYRKTAQQGPQWDRKAQNHDQTLMDTVWDDSGASNRSESRSDQSVDPQLDRGVQAQARGDQEGDRPVQSGDRAAQGSGSSRSEALGAGVRGEDGAIHSFQGENLSRQRGQELPLHIDRLGEEDDTIRGEASKGPRGSTGEEQQFVQQLKQTRERIHQQHRERGEAIRGEFSSSDGGQHSVIEELRGASEQYGGDGEAVYEPLRGDGELLQGEFEEFESQMRAEYHQIIKRVEGELREVERGSDQALRELNKERYGWGIPKPNFQIEGELRETLGRAAYRVSKRIQERIRGYREQFQQRRESVRGRFESLEGAIRRVGEGIKGFRLKKREKEEVLAMSQKKIENKSYPKPKRAKFRGMGM